MLTAAFRYKAWADTRTLAAVSRVDTVAFPAAAAFARQQLNHIVRVEELFRARLVGAVAPHGSTNAEPVPALPELDRRLGESDRWFVRYVESLVPDHRSEPVTFDFVDAQPGRMTRLEILFHIVNHGTYHRGAIGHALDLAGVPHPPDTYTVFVHATQPQRRERP